MRKKLAILLILSTVMVGSVAGTEWKQPKNTDRIDWNVEKQGLIGKITNSMFSINLFKENVEQGERIEGTISGDIDSVQKTYGDKGIGCTGDQVDIQIQWYGPDGEYRAGDTLTADECQNYYTGYKFDVWEDADDGEWEVQVKYRHEGMADLTGEYIHDFGTDTYNVEVENREDSDKDGYYDDEDDCPNEGDQGYGLDRFGCPVVAEEPLELTVTGPNSISAGESASFEADVDGQGTLETTWYLDGDQVSTGTSFSKTFRNEGTYDVKAELTNDKNTISETESVTVNVESPEASLQVMSGSGEIEVGRSITLDGSGSQKGTFRIKTYSWSIGGQYKSGRSVRWTPNREGTYNVRLEVSDGRGNKDTTSTSINVVKNYPKPTVNVVAPRQATVEETIVLDASQSTAKAGIQSIRWQVGAKTFTGRTVETGFQTEGRRQVTATVTDKEGQKTQKKFSINVTKNDPGLIGNIVNWFKGFFTK